MSNKLYLTFKSESQKAEIELGLKQIENGYFIEFDDFLKKVS